MAIEGLLGGGLNNPLLNIGAGLLSAAGPSAQPQSIGQGLVRGLTLAQSAQGQHARNQLIRQELEQRARQQQASKELRGLLGGQVGPTNEAAQRMESGMSPEQAMGGSRQQQLMGLLAEVAPQQFAQGLLGQMFQQERAEPSDIRSLRAIGIDPMSEQGQKVILDRLRANGAAGEQLDQMLKVLQVRSLQEEMAEARTEKERERTSARISTLNSLDRVREAARINERLRGTMAETGMGFGELRRAAAGPIAGLTRLFGGDDTRARQLAADMGRFDQLTRREAISDLFSGQVGAGTLTDAKMSTYLQTKPGFDQLPETNNRIFADMLQDSLDSASKLDISVADREEVEAMIKTLRARPETPRTNRASPARRENRVIDFNSLPD